MNRGITFAGLTLFFLLSCAACELNEAYAQNRITNNDQGVRFTDPVTGGGARFIVLPEEAAKPPEEQMLRVHFRNMVNDVLAKRIDSIEKIITETESIKIYQAKTKDLFIKHLGGFPERTPLNAQIVDKQEYDDYSLEKVIFESRPGFYVPALFYLPKGSRFHAPYPGVLVSCGHNEHGKTYPAYQQICILLAKNGFAVLCPDPIGQGERKQILTDNGNGKFSATLEHNIDGVAPILLGKSLANYMIWDGIRGIDYLTSRAEVDSGRIGCTGISGGGNITSYLMALDNRIDAAAPGCFITTIKRKNEHPGPGDMEQNIFGQIAAGMDHADYLHMTAPRPVLILSATLDFVPIRGTWESFREANRLYTHLGYASHISLMETYAHHGFSKELREGTTEWMQRWLKDINHSVEEDSISVQPDSVLQVTMQGQTLLMPGSRSVFDLNIADNELLKKQRLKVWNQLGKAERLSVIRQVTGIRKFGDIPRARLETGEHVQREGYEVQKVIFWTSDDLAIPGLLFKPQVAKGEPYLYLHDKGKEVDAYPGGPIENLVKRGHTVLAVDLTGIGETQMKPWRYRNTVPYVGTNLPEFLTAYRLGISFVKIRAEDILLCSHFLQQDLPAKFKTVSVVTVGETGVPALHAVALEEQMFGNLTLHNSLGSWEDVIHSTVTKNALTNVVHGALKYYDLPDLVSMIGKNRIKL